MGIQQAIAELINFRNLTLAQAEAAMNDIMNGVATPAQIAAYLVALRMKGETAVEIAGSAKSMRQHAIPVQIDLADDDILVDTVGTGGDGKQTFNISTTAAFVVAAAGLKVAKHGNRAASSRSGSADVLMALGGNLDLTPAQVAICVQEVGFGFLYAIHHHPAMRFAGPPRREIGQRTIFNILGPMTNPAGAKHQLIGVFAPELTEPMAQVLHTLGSEAAYVVHGADGLDELSTAGPNQVSRLHNGQITTYELDPASLGLVRGSIDQFVGGTAVENAQISRDILNGTDRGPRRDIVLLNTAVTLSLAGDDLATCLARAADAIDSGAAWRTLTHWLETTNRFA